jgi:hypothetical protein
MAGVAQHGDALRVLTGGSEVLHLAQVGTIPGVVVAQAAAKNGPGEGQLQWDGSRLYWKAPGSSSYGVGVTCPGDCSHLVEDGDDSDKWLRVDVYVDHLPTTPRDSHVFLDDFYENGPPHDDVTAGEASAGDVTAYTLTLRNDGVLPLKNLRAWITDPGVSGVTIKISDDGIVWVSPTTEGAGLTLPTLAPGATDTLHVQRTIGAGKSSETDVLTLLHFGWDGV